MAQYAIHRNHKKRKSSLSALRVAGLQIVKGPSGNIIGKTICAPRGCLAFAATLDGLIQRGAVYKTRAAAIRALGGRR